MVPGRDLDKIIAEKVMGWTNCHEVDSAHAGTLLQGVKPGEIPSIYTGAVRETYVPNYSTKIEAAWEVVEMFKEKGDYKIEISAYPKDKLWTIKAFHREGLSKSCTTSAETLPHAICLAALKSITQLQE